MRKLRQPTVTSIVEAFVRGADDFVTAKAIRAATGVPHISNALHELRGYRVLDCMRDGDQLWWFPLPPEQDTRHHTVAERAPETTPRKLRKPKT